MQKSPSLPQPLRSLSKGQKLVIGVVIAVLLILFIGSFNQSEEAGPAIGLAAQPFIVLALLSFGGGILSFVSPCTLPVLTAYFAFAFQSGRKQIAANTLSFMLGLATTFVLFGAVGFALGKTLLRNQNILLLVGGAVIMVMGVMSILGRGFGGIDTSGTGGAQPRSATVGGSYLFGLTFAVGWSSCVGPILGTVLTFAASSATVWNGMMLLFIYTLGLGLPLLVVSTFFGRLPRDSFFWRLLRGKGWTWNTHVFAIALIWALAIWRILVAVFVYAFDTYDVFAGQTFTTTHEIGLLVLVIVGAALWTFTSSEEKKVAIQLHSTQLISGALFIIIALLMLNGTLASINTLLSPDLSLWFVELEEKFIAIFGP